jgi:hypothetical protein
MASNVTNRETVRDLVAAGLTTALAGVATVYNHKKTDWGAVNPAVAVTSSGSYRRRDTNDYRSENDIYLSTFVFVLVEPSTEETAENTLDLIEKTISDWVIDNATTDDWALLEFDERSNVDDAPIAAVAVQYLRERFPLHIQLYSD